MLTAPVDSVHRELVASWLRKPTPRCVRCQTHQRIAPATSSQGRRSPARRRPRILCGTVAGASSRPAAACRNPSSPCQAGHLWLCPDAPTPQHKSAGHHRRSRRGRHENQWRVDLRIQRPIAHSVRQGFHLLHYAVLNCHWHASRELSWQ